MALPRLQDSGKGVSNRDAQIVPADAGGIAVAARILDQGGLVAVPTETVYGLAARADNPEAVAGIYRAKRRPAFNPLIVHVADLAAAARLAEFNPMADKLAAAFWPGALTLVLPVRADAGLAPAVTANLPTVALRCPAHPAMRALLAVCGLPLAAPSANPSGAVSPTTAAHVREGLGGAVDLILDGGPCDQGVESTIVAVSADGWRLLREGPVTRAEITELVGQSIEVVTPNRIEAPGQLASHYSPGKPVRLHADAAQADEFHIGFGAIEGDVNLSETGDLGEAAAQLYRALHLAAAASQPRIAVASIPEGAIGAAINDRLRRAAV